MEVSSWIPGPFSQSVAIMATSVPTSNATISVPRARFLFASFFVVASAIYSLSRIISGVNLLALYRSAMFSAIFTELLALKMSIPEFKMSPEVIQAVSSSPCLPYLSLSLFLWLNSSTFLVQMISMVIVNLLLILEYAPTDVNITGNPYYRVHLKPYADKILPRKANLLFLAAHLEILNLVLVIVSIIRMKGNLLQLMVFTQYLVSQYVSSAVMQQAIRFWDTIFTRMVNDPRCPPVVKVVDQKVREYLKKLVGFTTQFIQPPSSSAPHQRKAKH